MKYASLGSGSKGNGLVVQADGTTILIDCGFTIKETVSRLSRLNIEANSLDAIIVTHEHGDHIKGVGPFARKFKIPVYATPGTVLTDKLGKIEDLRFIEGYRSFSIGNFDLHPVAVPHDAREPAQFVVEFQQKRLGVLTDLGSISTHVEKHFCNCDGLILEANHDPVMLSQGPYPPSLKERVAGPWGHLSNYQAHQFLEQIHSDSMQHLVIAHISQQNNSLNIVQNYFQQWEEKIATVIYACQDEGFGWLTLN
ncbi:MBL fold metallo-hydrolase [Sessilibacter corallicola]|uniref:MBL fold metallo-hydrolase n=1 Tax=Sessilibacter corallicola TaxID=2904075 RepID=A0ABQ0A507_9GAMM|nr:MBL fold metallo-hydrolase [Sessilibacter corallicola]MCE2026788.1 MBL fold metallo-hydrolase [Sessilibacter corallicola]